VSFIWLLWIFDSLFYLNFTKACYFDFSWFFKFLLLKFPFS
jgi:hypothetical protein